LGRQYGVVYKYLDTTTTISLLVPSKLGYARDKTHESKNRNKTKIKKKAENEW
jgi:hypothetical protein